MESSRTKASICQGLGLFFEYPFVVFKVDDQIGGLQDMNTRELSIG
jgi:hypothetical protein